MTQFKHLNITDAKSEIAKCEVKAFADYGAQKNSVPHYFAEKLSGFNYCLRRISALAILLVCGGASPLSSQQVSSNTNSPEAVRLYTLDGGLTEFQDASYFSDTGEYDGKSLALPTPCYLIKHGKDWLLWDTGKGTCSSITNRSKFTMRCELPRRFSVSRAKTGPRIIAKLAPWLTCTQSSSTGWTKRSICTTDEKDKRKTLTHSTKQAKYYEIEHTK
jgi:hypothetical protein